MQHENKEDSVPPLLKLGITTTKHSNEDKSGGGHGVPVIWAKLVFCPVALVAPRALLPLTAVVGVSRFDHFFPQRLSSLDWM